MRWLSGFTERKPSPIASFGGRVLSMRADSVHSLPVRWNIDQFGGTSVTRLPLAPRLPAWRSDSHAKFAPEELSMTFVTGFPVDAASAGGLALWIFAVLK